MDGYLYTITCCGHEVDIYADQPSRCPGCHSTFQVRPA